jgi:hypothetical protein
LGLLIAIVVACWFGLSVRQAHNTDVAEQILSNNSTLSASQTRHVGALLRSAATVNPDRSVDLLRGELAASEGNRVRASQIFAGVTRSEPLNIDAWYELANVTTNPHTLSLVLHQIAALAPDVSKQK